VDAAGFLAAASAPSAASFQKWPIDRLSVLSLVALAARMGADPAA